MLGNYVTFPELLLWIPFVMGLMVLLLKSAKAVKVVSLISVWLTLGVAVVSLLYAFPAKEADYWNYNNVSYYWLRYIGSSFTLGLDGISHVFTLLTSLVFALVFMVTSGSSYEKPNAFYAMLLFWQSAITGVFVAFDVLVFYFFWIIVLVLTFFLMGRWGDSWKTGFAFKFFIYQFTGALLFLAAVLILYPYTVPVQADSAHSFTISAFFISPFLAGVQVRAFLLMAIPFFVMIPIFPFHTWFPGSSARSPYPVAMILGSVMVIVGLYGMIRLAIPLFSIAFEKFQDVIFILCVVSIVYSGFIALIQDDLKRLVAWASVTHVGIATLGVCSGNAVALAAGMFETINHGIIIAGLWMEMFIIEALTGKRSISSLGGIAKKSPGLAVFFFFVLFAVVGLPLTGSFYAKWHILEGLAGVSTVALVGLILGYLLTLLLMINIARKVFFGTVSEAVAMAGSMSVMQVIALVLVILAILILGIYPDAVTDLFKASVDNIIKRTGG